MGLKAIREDEDKAQALGVPTFTYKLVAFVVSAFFTALAGGLYALWFGFLDPIFQFSILVGSYMVLMSLLGGIRSLFGPLLGAVIVGYAVEYFKNQYGDTQFHLVAMGLLLGAGRAVHARRHHPGRSASLVDRFRPQARLHPRGQRRPTSPSSVVRRSPRRRRPTSRPGPTTARTSRPRTADRRPDRQPH